MSRRRFLVFETGGTKLVAALADAEGRLLETRILRRNQDDRAEHSLERLIETGRELAKGVDLSGVGFGYGGAVNRAVRRPMICLHEPGWEDLDPVARLEAEFGAPTAIENDCKLAALAEARLGAGKGSDTVFYITIGTGIGGGLVHNGSIVALSPLGEAEIGHVVVDPEGPECDCGNRGCLESLCAGPNLPRLYPGEMVTSKDVFERAAAGEARALAAVERAADYLGRALSMAANLACPDVFVVGGGLGAAYPDFLERIEARAKAWTVPYFRDRVQVRPSALREQVVTQGAALLIVDRVRAV
ncbi:MAG: ROK family protein [Bryobacterales bacterium]